MSLKRNRNQGTSVSSPGSPKSQNTTKKVVDIILSSNHIAYNSPEDIGTIFFVEIGFNQDYTDSTALPSAKPLNKNNFTYPTIGELVQIVKSTSNDVYNDLEGDISATTNYYTPAINIHNNTASNALPLEKETKKKKPKRESNVKAFEFKKEFKSFNQATADKLLDNYLRSLGYTSGRNDARAPRYSLSQDAKGTYIFRLDDSEDNNTVAVKLGNYFKENPELQPLTPSEGDSIMEGKNGQRIRFTTTGPTGTNAISNNVTDAPDDGNPSIGDKAMVLSLGNGSQENVTSDAASIYMLENQSIPIDATSTNVDSLNSTYEAPPETFESIAKKPQVDVSKTQPDSGTQVQEDPFDGSSISNFVKENNGLPAQSETIDFSDDPVFAALDEAQDEGLLKFDMESIEIAGTEYDEEAETQSEVSQPTTEDGDTTAEIPLDGNYYQINLSADKVWKQGGVGIFKNKSGKILRLNQPDNGLTMKKTTKRTIKYLVLHTAGSSTSWTAADLTRFFFNDRDREGPEGRIPIKSPDNDGPWNTGGYHWIVDQKGKATRVYSDDITTNGAKGINKNSIHLNWIGGFSPPGQPINVNITNGQIYTLKRLILKYINSYPNIKVLGHNQVSNKPCPLFNVPTFLKQIGVDGNNIERRAGFANRGFWAEWEGSELTNESNRLANLIT